MDELLAQLVTIVTQLEDIAPHVWAVCLRQVWIANIANLIWSLLCFATTGGFAKLALLANQKRREKPHDDWEIGIALASIGVVFALFVALVLLDAAIRGFANPHYYAIRNLLRIVSPE